MSMRIVDIVSAFQTKDGSGNTIEKDRENLGHIFRRLIFNHLPELNHGVEGHICMDRKGQRISEASFADMVRDLQPGRELVLVWSYYRDPDTCFSSGASSAKKAREDVKRAFAQELERFPLGHFTVATRAKTVTYEAEGCDPEYDADLIISLLRKG